MKSVILKEISKLMVPLIQVFGIYIIIFGHLSPGGGFAGGTILASSLILYRLVHGKGKAQQKYSFNLLKKWLCGGLIFYGLLKGYSFITGGSHLKAPQLPLGKPGDILSGGYILPLNVCVGLIVAIVMYVLFSLFYEGEV